MQFALQGHLLQRPAPALLEAPGRALDVAGQAPLFEVVEPQAFQRPVRPAGERRAPGNVDHAVACRVCKVPVDEGVPVRVDGRRPENRKFKIGSWAQFGGDDLCRPASQSVGEIAPGDDQFVLQRVPAANDDMDMRMAVL